MAAILTVSSCKPEHLIRDPSYRKLVQQEFEKNRKLAAARNHDLFDVFSEDLTIQEQEGLKFLYAFMPLNDLADYTGSFFLDHVKASLRARKKMAWGKKIPDDIFLHFVLPYRVNNENLDSFRMVYYDEITQRVKGLSMKNAALEINHWCHEKVAYQPADIRTSSPMNTVKNARGRCGEESTFTVAALRTAGIPARQVYVPRWAHTDDNHAWVEVWIDGKWHFMGACEPEPALDMGWFKEPARRAMLIHTKAFGAYFGNEPLVRKAEKYAVINSLPRYAETKNLVVKVQNNGGIPVAGANVEFQLYNYAEFYPLAKLQTSDNGYASLLTGLGDLLVWAYKGDDFGFKKVSVGDTDTLTITLDGKRDSEYSLNLDIYPPPEKIPFPVSDVGREENTRRLKKEDSIRLAYMATFFDEKKAAAWATNHQYPPDRTAPLLVKSMGNHTNITSFLLNSPDSLKNRAINLLETVSNKDLRDAEASVLLDHLLHGAGYSGRVEEKNAGIFKNYILAPRVDNEQLTAYRSFFEKNFKKNEIDFFREDPANLIKWIDRNIRIDDADNYYDVPITPPGVFSLKISDHHSRKIFFVAVCRTFGIPARLETARQVPQYLTKNGEWKDVFFHGDPVLPGKSAYLMLSSANAQVPRYYIQFTLSRFYGGKYHTLEYSYQKKVDEFPSPLPVDPGDYMLVTGNRQSDGSVLTVLSFFPVRKGEKKNVRIILRENYKKLRSFGKLPDKATVFLIHSTKDTLLSAMLGNKGMILCWIDPDQEPSKHVLNEIPDVMPGLQKWGGTLAFLLPDMKMAGTFDPENYPLLAGKVSFLTDKNGKILEKVRKQSGRTIKVNLPVILVTDDKGNLLDYTEGYRVGIGNHLIKVIHALSKE